MTTAAHEPIAGIKRFVEELERLWQRRLLPVTRELTRGHSGRLARRLDFVIDYFVPKLTNATRMLKEHLTAEGVSVWLSAGCLEELASMASAAAARTRQAHEPYTACLQREIASRAQFIRQWTTSDTKFDQIQCGDLVLVARKYALPRPWRAR